MNLALETDVRDLVAGFAQALAVLQAFVAQDAREPEAPKRHPLVELFDDDALQARLAAFYRDIDRHFPRDRVAHVNGDAGADAVHRAVLTEVEAILARA